MTSSKARSISNVEVRLDTLGPDHVNVATSYHNFALIYQDFGDFEQGKEYQQRALEIQWTISAQNMLMLQQDTTT